MLMRGDAEVPKDGGVPLGELTTEQVYEETCVKWPQENSVKEAGDTGSCCLQWVDDGQRKT